MQSTSKPSALDSGLIWGLWCAMTIILVVGGSIVVSSGSESSGDRQLRLHQQKYDECNRSAEAQRGDFEAIVRGYGPRSAITADTLIQTATDVCMRR